MAAMPLQEIVKAGLEASYAAVNNGDTIKEDGSERTLLHVNNGSGAPITVTIPAVLANVTNEATGSIEVPDIEVTVTNGEARFIGPFPRAYVNSSGNVTVNYSATTTVTAAALRIRDN